MDPDTVSEYEPLAQARMDPGAWAYYAGAAGAKVTLRENRNNIYHQRPLGLIRSLLTPLLTILARKIALRLSRSASRPLSPLRLLSSSLARLPIVELSTTQPAPVDSLPLPSPCSEQEDHLPHPIAV